MQYYGRGGETDVISGDDLREAIYTALEKLGTKKKVLAVPPDFTRYHSRAGLITGFVYHYYKESLTDILPALGTHTPMTNQEFSKMFVGVPKNLFRAHNWRSDLQTLGEVPSEFIIKASEGHLNYSWPAQVNKILVRGHYDLILSIGQVVPHEVVGMANYNKNILIGTGGKEGIDKSHFLGASYGMERIMGRPNTPVRKVLNYASDNFANHLPIVYILTVVGKDENGKSVVRGLFIGDDYDNFKEASTLSLKVNFKMVGKPLKKVVVYLDPSEFKSTWLGNKSIYRTRMAIADGGELIVLAPGVRAFGEDKTIDGLIRKHGYLSTPEVLRFVKETDELKNNLSAAAHLIHGSSENRFTITYCPGHLTREEIEGVHFKYADLGTMIRRYAPDKLRDGFTTLPDGEEIFYVSNPALGLWACKNRFNDLASSQ
jgi:nickel-dependent lactate racemase